MARETTPGYEQRKSMLTDSDIERIGEAFDRKMQGLFEMIGYDTSTPDSRSEIRKDHEFVRDARQARAVLVTAVMTSIGGAIVLALWAGAKVLAHQ